MKIHIFATFFTVLEFSSSSVFATSLCTSNEEIIWSCSVKNKIYSACASKSLDRKNGYLQFRVAKNNQTEFLFPKEKTHPSGKFKFSLLAQGAMLSFRNASYEYELYEGLMGKPSISITKNESSVSEIECDDGSYTLTETNIQNLLSRAGIEN